MRKLQLWILRICVSALLLTAVFWFLPAGDVWTAIQAVPLTVWLAVLIMFLIAHVVAALKWWLLTDQTDVSAASFIRAHFAGLMGNLCLPGVIGGDLVRCGWVLRSGIGKARLGVACLVDRLLDMACLFLLAIAGALVTAENTPAAQRLLIGVTASLSVGAVVAAACVWVLFSKRRSPKLAQIVEAIENSLRRPWILIRSFLLALVVQTCFVCLSIALGAYTGVDVGVSVWFLAWPLAKLAAFAPITLAGLGVRESVLILLMEPFGSDAPAIAAASLLWQTILFGGGLIGGLIAIACQPSQATSTRSDEPTSV